MNINWNKYFDNIYVLSGCSNFEKREQLKNEFKRIGLKKYHWWYGYENNLIDHLKYQAYDITKSNMITTYSHYGLIKTAYELGYENILILEDDVRFLKDLNKIQEQLKIFKKKKNKVDFYFFDYIKVSSMICFFSAVYLNRKAMKYIIYCIEHNIAPVDTFILYNFMNDDNIDQYAWYWVNNRKLSPIVIPKFANILPIYVEKSPIRICIQNNKTDDYDKDIDKYNIEDYNL